MNNNEAFLLWTQLEEHGIVHASVPPEIPENPPWFTKVITVLGSWIAAICLSIFLGLISALFQSAPISFVFGVSILFGCAKLFHRENKSEFVTHFILPLSLIGQAALGYSILDMIPDPMISTLICAGIQGALIIIMKNNIHRIWSTFMTCLFFWLFLKEIQATFLFSPILFLVMTYIWLNLFQWMHKYTIITSVGYGVSCSLLINNFYLREQGYGHIADISSGCMGLLFIALTWILLRRYKKHLSLPRFITCLIVSVGIAVLSFYAIGTATAIALVLLGFQNRNRILLGTGTSAFLVFLSIYYYTLNITLLQKSMILASVSVLLLFAHFILVREQTKEEPNHAT